MSYLLILFILGVLPLAILFLSFLSSQGKLDELKSQHFSGWLLIGGICVMFLSQLSALVSLSLDRAAFSPSQEYLFKTSIFLFGPGIAGIMYGNWLFALRGFVWTPASAIILLFYLRFAWKIIRKNISPQKSLIILGTWVILILSLSSNFYAGIVNTASLELLYSIALLATLSAVVLFLAAPYMKILNVVAQKTGDKPIPESNHKSRIKGKHIASITLGILLLVGGIILLVVRTDLTIDIVGRDVALKEAFVGGSSTRNASNMILVCSVLSLVSGSLLLVMGMIFALKNK